MSRDRGQLVFPANFEREFGAPLDASMLVSGITSLTNPNTFITSDEGQNYVFAGMITVVVADTPENNGLYILKNIKHTDIKNWQKLQPAIDTSTLTTSSKDIIEAINELNAKINSGGSGDGSDIDVDYINQQLININAQLFEQSNTISSLNKAISSLSGKNDEIQQTLENVQEKIENISPDTHTSYISSNNKSNIDFDGKPFLELENDALVEYHITLFINGDNCFLVKTLEFSSNTLKGTPEIPNFCTTDEDAYNADQLNADISMELDTTDPFKLYISITTAINCTVYAQVNKNIKFQKTNN